MTSQGDRTEQDARRASRKHGSNMQVDAQVTFGRSTPRGHGASKGRGGGLLTVRLGPHEKGHSLEPLDVRRRHMARAAVIPLAIGVQGVQFDASSRIRHTRRRSNDVGRCFSALRLTVAPPITSRSLGSCGTDHGSAHSPIRAPGSRHFCTARRGCTMPAGPSGRSADGDAGRQAKI